VSGAGPSTNLLSIVLLVTSPKEFITFNPDDFYVFPWIILCAANIIISWYSLWPCYINIDGNRIPNDSLRMLSLPFLSAREVARELSVSWLVDGHNLERIGNYRQAIESFSKAIQYDRDCVAAYRGRGNAYHSMGDDRQALDNYQQAISCISETIDIDRLNAANYYFRALIYYDWTTIDASKLENAIEDLTTAIGIDRCDVYLYYLRGALYSYSDRKSQAIADFTAVIKLQYDADAFYNRGVTHYQTKNYQAAIKDLDIVIDLDGNNISAYYCRGNAKYALENSIGAVEDYARAKLLSSSKNISSEDADGFYARGIAHIRLGDKVSAIEDLEMAESLCLKYANNSLLKQIREKLEKTID
jgi:tetratricopeptide (TPR) repeat protein